MSVKRFDWLPAVMPGVQVLIGQVRREWAKDRWFERCWRAGVVEGLPGHFWAAEGSVQVGMPWDADAVAQWLQLQAEMPGVAMVCIADRRGQVARHVYLREPTEAQGAVHGAH